MAEHQRQTQTHNQAQTSAPDDLAAEYGEVREEERLDWPRLQAYLREHEGESMLCVANLSRAAQAVELNLAQYRTRVPVELLGRTASATLETTELNLRGPKPRHQSYDHDTGYQASFDGVIAHFVDCLLTGAPFETDPADNLETLRLVEHAYWAAGIHGPTVRQ